uniref:Secreted protein n=1 Tax=Panagrellus redivivus TaxID=6233 RepID=A0A7E4UPI0_PANRE
MFSQVTASVALTIVYLTDMCGFIMLRLTTTTFARDLNIVPGSLSQISEVTNFHVFLRLAVHPFVLRMTIMPIFT